MSTLSTDELSALLQTGLKQLGITANVRQQEQCLQYLALLQKWNKTYNLTAVRDVGQMVGVHILDSLAVLPHIPSTGNLLDVGSGGGLPGIPLAIMRPDLLVTMLDSSQKKTVFVRQAISELELKNAAVVCERLENFQPGNRFDAVISRAFAELSDFVHGAGHLVQAAGTMLAMKGAAVSEEIRGFQGKKTSKPLPGLEFLVVETVDLKVPQVNGERCLVVLKSTTKTESVT